MATNIYKRNFSGANSVLSSEELARKYTNMLKKVESMITRQPTYTTWISFQIGKTGRPVVFNTSSTVKKENLIASLNIDKNGSGICNAFKLVVQYDPFDNGQQPTDQIEALDELIGNALSYDMSDDTNMYKCYLQYGYNDTEDANMISPKYECILTGVNSQVDWASGLTTYTFEGNSLIGTDCDFNANFDDIKGWNLMDLIGHILYYYYGDKDNPPSYCKKGGYDTFGASPKYRIEIPEHLFEDAVSVDVPATTGSPWSYCLSVLEGKMSAFDTNSGKYSDTSTLNYNEIPRYEMYITDTAECPTIRVDYVSPDNKGKTPNLSIDYDFNWGLQDQSLVIKWEPEVNLMVYFIHKQKLAREEATATEKYTTTLTMIEEYKATKEDSQQAINNVLDVTVTNGPVQAPEGTDNSNIPSWRRQSYNPISSIPITGIKGGTVIENSTSKSTREQVQEAYEKELKTIVETKKESMRQDALASFKKHIEEYADELREMYNASLTIVGIPADIPLTSEIRIKPRVLESVSRTAGVYIVKGCSDTIAPNGTFTTTLKLLRVRSL